MLGAPSARVDEIGSWLRAFRDGGRRRAPGRSGGIRAPGRRRADGRGRRPPIDRCELRPLGGRRGDLRLRSPGEGGGARRPPRRVGIARLGDARAEDPPPGRSARGDGIDRKRCRTSPRDLRAAIIAPREDPLPRRPRAYALVPADRRVGPDRRPPRPARRQRRPAARRSGGRPSRCDDHARVHRHARPPDADRVWRCRTGTSRRLGSAEELLALARERAAEGEGPVVLLGFDETRWSDPTHPLMEALDAVTARP